jgi:ribosome-associated protein
MSKKPAKKSQVKSQKSKGVKKKAAAKTKTTTKKSATVKTVKKPAEKKAAEKKPKAAKGQPVLLKAIIEGLEERKAKNITVLDLTGLQGRSFDYFVIADAESRTHVESIAGSVEEEVKKNIGERPFHTEGWQNAEWILLDYVNIIVHVFQKPVREFYNLEGLWADADVQKIN